MALLNFSLPYATPAPPTPYIAGGELGGFGGYNHPVVNSLWNHPQPQQQQHLGGRPTYNYPPPPPPSVPSRTSSTVPRRQSNEPYRNQVPYQQQQQQQPPPPPQQSRQQQQQQQQQQQPPPQQQEAKRTQRYYSNDNFRTNTAAPPQKPEAYPSIPAGYTKVTEYTSPDAKTSLHAVLDYDDDFDDYSYDDEDVSELPPELRHNPMPEVTPIQGPIFLKNGTVPVVPLFAHSVINNGTLVQIPILWTALSVALGLEIRGEIIRGVPCIKRFHQLFCPTAGNSYPIERIERFIDDNKALMKRMYGEFQMSTEYGPPSRELYGDAAKRTVKRDADDGGGRRKARKAPAGAGAPDPVVDATGGESYFSKLRQTRQSFRNNQSSESGRVDACESKVEITTPYWASSSAGKIRAIVNTQHFEQAIHQEVCSSKVQTKRCTGDCGCEQKYKWHRLLAYDPDNDCKGIFMDWFLFPSCCVCRCAPLFGNQ